MISGVLTLASRSLRTIMTPRNEISWIDCRQSADDIRRQLLETPHSLFPVCEGSLDQLLGVVRAKDLLMALKQGVPLAEFAAQHTPIVVLESLDVINVLDVLRQAKGRLVMVSDEFGEVQGLVTPLDVLEAIAGEFPDEDETPDIVTNESGWLVKGSTDLHTLEQTLGVHGLVLGSGTQYASLAGLLLAHFDRMPAVGAALTRDGLRFTVVEVEEYRIEKVQVERIPEDPTPLPEA